MEMNQYANQAVYCGHRRKTPEGIYACCPLSQQLTELSLRHNREIEIPQP